MSFLGLIESLKGEHTIQLAPIVIIGLILARLGYRKDIYESALAFITAALAFSLPFFGRTFFAQSIFWLVVFVIFLLTYINIFRGRDGMLPKELKSSEVVFFRIVLNPLSISLMAIASGFLLPFYSLKVIAFLILSCTIFYLFLSMALSKIGIDEKDIHLTKYCFLEVVTKDIYFGEIEKIVTRGNFLKIDPFDKKSPIRGWMYVKKREVVEALKKHIAEKVRESK